MKNVQRRISVTLSEKIYNALRGEAKVRRVSVGGYAGRLIEAAIERQDKLRKAYKKLSLGERQHLLKIGDQESQDNFLLSR
jgi:hypothetical protein